MPEGDTIFRTAASLRRWLEGRRITGARATADVDAAILVGARVTAVEARAKHLLIRFSNGLSLHTHMRMTGSWHLYPTGEPWRKAAHRARVVLDAEGRTAVCFDAPVVELFATGDERRHPVLSRLGPDVLADVHPEVGEVCRRARLAAQRSPTVGEMLLDQQVVSGIGNVYRCESLFLEGVNPFTPVDGITDDRIGRLVLTATGLMRTNAGVSGPARSFGGGPDRPWVYRRAGRPCRRCGTPINRQLLGAEQRSVYWCPSCQPMAAGGAGSGAG